MHFSETLAFMTSLCSMCVPSEQTKSILLSLQDAMPPLAQPNTVRGL